MKSNRSYGLAVIAALAAGVMLFAGCEGNDTGDPNAKAGINFSGTYKKGGSSITSPTRESGEITELSLSQAGTSLEAVDNNGVSYEGSLGSIPGEGNTEVPFNLRGNVTAGLQANLNGVLKQRSSTSAEMTGTWIESTFSASISATATITPVVVVDTNPPQVTVVVTNAPDTSTNRFPRIPRL